MNRGAATVDCKKVLLLMKMIGLKLAKLWLGEKVYAEI
jgi:hypothetical protein